MQAFLQGLPASRGSSCFLVGQARSWNEAPAGQALPWATVLALWSVVEGQPCGGHKLTQAPAISYLLSVRIVGLLDQ